MNHLVREEMVGEEITSQKNCVWRILSHRVKSPNKVASGVGCFPRLMSE